MKFTQQFFIIINVCFCINEALTYKAAIYEHYLQTDGTLEKNLEQYTNVINDANSYAVDILVFPENGLIGNIPFKNRRELIENASYVPNPDENIVPCNSSNDNSNKYSQIIHKFSCLASKYRTYLVINLPEKYDCNAKTQRELNDSRQCADDKFYLFNTNVVFDRNGQVVARYRKYNLYGEILYNSTLVPTISTFTTDFNETFGLFTCFDIFFDVPALTLVRNNVKNILFPTRWMSELPFLTAVQTQSSWAYRNNVTLLAANINLPEQGSSGSGIYLPEQNREYVFVTGKTESSLLVVTIPQNTQSPKNDVIFKRYTNNSVSVTTGQIPSINPNDLDDIQTVIRDLSEFVFKKVPLQESVNEKICQRGSCCEFQLKLNINENLLKITRENQTILNYFLIIRNGTRSFLGVNSKAGIETCALIGCEGDFTHCGNRYSKYERTIWPIEFEQINITANFPHRKNVIHFPNSLNSSFVPISSSSWIWKRINSTTLTFQLVKPEKEIRTFGIYGRNFDLDTKVDSMRYNVQIVPYSSSPRETVSRIIFSFIVFLLFFQLI